MLKKRSFLGPEFTKLHLGAGLRPDPLGEFTTLPQTPSCTKGGKGWEMRMKERWKGITGSKEKRDQGKGETWNNGVQYVSRIVEVRYWQPYRFAPLKMSPSLWPPHSKKLAPPLLNIAKYEPLEIRQ